jgi:predicted transcriptional regulator
MRYGVSALRLHHLSPYVCSMSDTASFSVRVPRELHEELAALADQDRRSVSNLIRLALEDYASEQRRGERSHRGRAA